MESTQVQDFSNFIIFGSLALFLLAMVLVFFLIMHQKRILAEKSKLQEFKIQQQKAMMESIIDAQEKEQKRIANDLHDEFGSLTTLLNLNNGHLVKSLNDSKQSEELIKMAEENKNITKQMAELARQISHDLLPPGLVHSGLLQALRDLISSLQKHSDIDISFDSQVSRTEISTKSELSLFRIIKEWLQNGIKHSQASQISVDVDIKNGNLQVVISDNGIAFDFEQSKNESSGLGLKSMEARLEMLNSKVHFERINQMNKTSFSVPIEESNSNEIT